MFGLIWNDKRSSPGLFHKKATVSGLLPECCRGLLRSNVLFSWEFPNFAFMRWTCHLRNLFIMTKTCHLPSNLMRPQGTTDFSALVCGGNNLFHVVILFPSANGKYGVFWT